LKGKVALVTGASSGIGSATALALAGAGARVALGARRTDRLAQLEAKIRAEGGDVISCGLDVAQRPQCEAFVKAAMDRWGAIDILVNNAGLMPLSFLKSLKVDEWEQMVDVNIKGVLFCTAAVLEHMRKRKTGHIVNISSVAGRVVFPAGSVYCATKHAVNAFTEGLRQELSARSNIRVTCIEPGVVATELEFVENTKRMEALRAEDIADSVLYAVGSPPHVNVNEILIRPITQER
ncbi:Uncharacterized oxidoreductase SSP1627, partial [Geodia barretti]